MQLKRIFTKILLLSCYVIKHILSYFYKQGYQPDLYIILFEIIENRIYSLDTTIKFLLIFILYYNNNYLMYFCFVYGLVWFYITLIGVNISEIGVPKARPHTIIKKNKIKVLLTN